MTPRRRVLPTLATGLALLVVVLAAAACARPSPPTAGGPAAVAVRDFSFATDTFAFPNEIRSKTPPHPDLYANYCFVLARALRQFHAGARFDPAAPKLDREGYVARVRQVVARVPWDPPLLPAERVVIPGYPDLRTFSRDEERAMKVGLGGRFRTVIDWSLWRTVVPVTAGHQESVARETVGELRRQRLVQLLITNWPKPELNHTVVAFGYRDTAAGVEFAVWDPNDPWKPGVITFLRQARRFYATSVFDTEAGPIRAFWMTYSWLL